MSVAEIIQKIHELSPEDRETIRRELNTGHPEDEETPEMLAAVDEGLRSLREEGTITLDELKDRMKSWNFESP